MRASTSKSVRDYPQRAIIKDGTVTIQNKCGSKILRKVSFPLSKWEELEGSFGNPHWHKREFIKTLGSVSVADTPEGDSLRERLWDSQIFAIQTAFELTD